MSRSDATDFNVIVLEGPFAGQVLSLSGRALPFRSASGGEIAFGHTQRVKTVWYQGNRVATQLVFGSQLDPTTINGVWQERYLGADVPINLVETFTALLNQGVQLEVNWSTIARQGVISKFVWKPGNPTGGISDIEWSLTFDWMAMPEDDPTALQRITDSDSGSIRDSCVAAGQAFSALRDQINSIMQAYDAFAGLRNLAFSNQDETPILNLMAGSDNATTAISSVAAQLGTQTELPGRFLEQASTALTSVQDTTGSLARSLSNVSHNRVAPTDDVAAQIQFAVQRANVIEQAWAAIAVAWVLQNRLEAQLRPESFAIVYPTPGQDLRDIAIQWYGRADYWTRIALVNGIFESSKVPADVQQLLVPLTITNTTDPNYQGITDLTGATS